MDSRQADSHREADLKNMDLNLNNKSHTYKHNYKRLRKGRTNTPPSPLILKMRWLPYPILTQPTDKTLCTQLSTIIH